MNRIKISPLVSDTLSVPGHSSLATADEVSSPEIARTRAGNFSIFVPMHYEKNYAYPLIVWLHDQSQSSEQLQQVMLHMSLRNFTGIAPQSPVVSPSSRAWEQDFETIDAAYDAVLDCIDEASLRFKIASQRIFLAGMGRGGTMAFRLAFESPERFAGVLSINGPIPDQTPLRDWSRCREMPVFWAHSRESEDFLQDDLCQQLKLLHVAGFCVTLRQYPQSDLLCPTTMSDMNHWVMETISTSISDRQTK